LARGLFIVVALACGCSSGSGSDSGPSGSACGPNQDLFDTPELDWLVGHWEQGPGGDQLTFARSPRQFVQHVRRQVGDDETPAIPYPTTCTFERVSNDFCVWKMPSGSAAHPYALQFYVASVKLIDDPDNSSACGAFISEQQSLISAGKLSYSDQFGQSAGGMLDMDGTVLTRTN
jgi:hypothetical protein